MYRHDGWRSVEAFIFRYLASGDHHYDITDAVAQIEAHLNTNLVGSFLEQMGLLSAGYLFDAKWEKTFQFFELGEHRSKHYKTPYIWKNKSRAGIYGPFVHNLFVAVRGRQREQLNELTYHFEEYYLCLPQIHSGRSYDERAYYCPVGELLFWLYAWRLLWYFEQMVSPDEAFVPGRVCLAAGVGSRGVPWPAESLQDPLVGQAERDLALDRWAAEYRALCLWSSKMDSPTVWLASLGEFVRNAMGMEVTAKGGLATLDSSLQRTVGAWLLSRADEPSRRSSAALRAWVEANAPAPLLPFYVWIALDELPKTYFVCPIWVSPLLSPAVIGAEKTPTPIVGLALCGVAPLTEWDDTLHTAKKEGEVSLRQTTKRDLVEFLSLLGQPAVELNFYAPLAAELQTAERERITARHAHVLRRGLIHEIGQIAHKVLLWTNGCAKEQNIIAECTALKLASEALAKILEPTAWDKPVEAAVIFNSVTDAFRYHKFELDLELPLADSLEGYVMSAALEYIIIELVRNAYRKCEADGDGRKRIFVSCTTRPGDDGPAYVDAVTVLQRCSEDVAAIDTRVMAVAEAPKRGLQLVEYIVSKMIRGYFTLQPDGGHARAYVEYLIG